MKESLKNWWEGLGKEQVMVTVTILVTFFLTLLSVSDSLRGRFFLDPIDVASNIALVSFIFAPILDIIRLLKKGKSVGAKTVLLSAIGQFLLVFLSLLLVMKIAGINPFL